MQIEQREKQGGKIEKRTSIKSKMASWLAIGAVSCCGLLPLSSASADITNARSKYALTSNLKHKPKRGTEIPRTVGNPVRDLCDVPALANYLRSVLRPAVGPLLCKDRSFAVYPWANGIGSWKQVIGDAASNKPLTTMLIIAAIVPNDESRSSALLPVDHNVWKHDLSSVSSSKYEKIIKIFSGTKEAIIFEDVIAPNEPYGSYEEGIETNYGGHVVYLDVISGGRPISDFPLSDEESLLKLMIEDGFTH